MFVPFRFDAVDFVGDHKLLSGRLSSLHSMLIIDRYVAFDAYRAMTIAADVVSSAQRIRFHFQIVPAVILSVCGSDHKSPGTIRCYIPIIRRLRYGGCVWVYALRVCVRCVCVWSIWICRASGGMCAICWSGASVDHRRLDLTVQSTIQFLIVIRAIKFRCRPIAYRYTRTHIANETYEWSARFIWPHHHIFHECGLRTIHTRALLIQLVCVFVCVCKVWVYASSYKWHE